MTLDQNEVKQAIRDYLKKRNVDVELDDIRPCSNVAFITIPVVMKKKS